MKITSMSDLHMEFDANVDLPGGDILTLNGDIWCIKHMLEEKSFCKNQYINFCREQLSKYKHVLIITGNHESYGAVYDEMDTILRLFLRDYAPNAVLLNNQSIEIDGVTFLGTPLWGTCGKNKKQRDIIRNGMNDFQLIRTTQGAPKGVKARMKGMHRVFEPEDAAKLHLDAVNWLWLELPKHKRVVVLSHHAPSFMSAGGGHAKDDMLYAAYCSNLEPLIKVHPQIHTWIHGHTHKPENYKVGTTRILSNPRGYLGHEHIARFFEPSAIDFDTNDVKGT